MKVKSVIFFFIMGMLLFTSCGKKQDETEMVTGGVTVEEIPASEETVSPEPESETMMSEEEEPEDPQNTVLSETGAKVEPESFLSANETENMNCTIGIDVARYQGTIDWKQVAGSGIQFAMIRVGYRTKTGGEIIADGNAKYNMQEATANGIKIGAYFFSTAVTEQEAVDEANWVADYISQYKITYPVAYNCEGFQNPDSRQYGMEKADRTKVALAFLKQIYAKGYTPMFYAAKNEMENNTLWNTTEIDGICKVWVSQYPAVPFPDTPKSSYGGVHSMWQYTNQGSIPGISKPVDVDIAYFGYEQESEAKNTQTPDMASPDMEVLMKFTDVSEEVTAKDSVNLRDRPEQGDNSQVLAVLKNGEKAVRTGISDSGWSRLDYNGVKVYAVSSFLTTDLAYTTPVEQPAAPEQPVVPEQPDNGIKTKFADVTENVTAKIEVNLRTLPSVTNPDAVVVAVLKYGEWIPRTGVSDNGWSRVEYNGQTLYCVSSYLSTAP